MIDNSANFQFSKLAFWMSFTLWYGFVVESTPLSKLVTKLVPVYGLSFRQGARIHDGLP